MYSSQLSLHAHHTNGNQNLGRALVSAGHIARSVHQGLACLELITTQISIGDWVAIAECNNGVDSHAGMCPQMCAAVRGLLSFSAGSLCRHRP